MVHSLGLTLYGLRPRRPAARNEARPPRPEGRLLWIHAPSTDVESGLIELAKRLSEEEACSILMTTSHMTRPVPGVCVDRPPEDSAAEVRAFLDHWRPNAGLFSDGELRPALIHEAHERGIPLVMADARTPYLLPGREGWFPGLVRSSLMAFRNIMALDESSARQFRKAGALPSAVQVTGRLEEGSAVLPCLEAERAALAKLLATRPVWLAAGLPQEEEDAVIAAHRAALGLAHRLLLIVAPQQIDRAEPFARRLEAEEGWVVARRAEDEEPERDVEVYIADGMAELGLWYRIAPITFMGGSLGGKGCVRSPMEPASLGSAILYGPRPGPFGNSFGRLGAARAARAVGNARDLGDALSDLMAPDKVARLAQSAWGVASEGAEVTDHMLKTLRGILAEAGK